MLAVAPGCDLEVRRGPEWLMIRLRDYDPDGPDPLPLAERIWRLLDQHFTYRVVLELDQVDVLSSPLIGQLLQLQRRIVQHGGLMRLCGLSPYNRRVLEVCGLDRQMPAYDDVREAVMGLPRPKQPR
jgi:anti-anti-sigma factor